MIRHQHHLKALVLADCVIMVPRAFDVKASRRTHPSHDAWVMSLKDQYEHVTNTISILGRDWPVLHTDSA